MYCIKCGKELPVDARFCIGCGVPINAPKTVEPNSMSSVAQSQENTEPIPLQEGFAAQIVPQSAPNALQPNQDTLQSNGWKLTQTPPSTSQWINDIPLLNQAFSSTPFLVCLIIFSLGTIINFIGIFTATLTRELFDMGNIIEMADTVGVIIAPALMFLPHILGLVAGWMLYQSSRVGKITTTPFTIFAVAQFLTLALMLLLAILVIVAAVIFTSAGGWGMMFGIIILIPIAIFLSVAAGVKIGYCAIGIKSSFNMMKTVNTGILATKALKVFAILNMLSGSLNMYTGVSTFFSVLSSSLSEDGSPFSIITTLAFLTTSLSGLGLLLLGYVLVRITERKKRMG